MQLTLGVPSREGATLVPAQRRPGLDLMAAERWTTSASGLLVPNSGTMAPEDATAGRVWWQTSPMNWIKTGHPADWIQSLIAFVSVLVAILAVLLALAEQRQQQSRRKPGERSRSRG